MIFGFPVSHRRAQNPALRLDLGLRAVVFLEAARREVRGLDDGGVGGLGAVGRDVDGHGGGEEAGEDAEHRGEDEEGGGGGGGGRGRCCARDGGGWCLSVRPGGLIRKDSISVERGVGGCNYIRCCDVMM